MKRTELLLITAISMQIIAWCLPALSESGPGALHLWGWQAWLVTSEGAYRATLNTLLHPSQEMTWSSLGELFLVSASSVGTLLFAFTPIILRSSLRVIRISAWIALACAFLNVHWMFQEEKIESLRIGYYLWWLSFFPLSATLFLRSISGKPAETA